MTTLGNYNHDFPRLAKQSGYFFQLYRGRVNWTEIENLNVDEIVETRNFQLLEQNLVNVINCNLEREYDLKILDQKFVKLFKLAQLGVDYLSYCEMYLDRCVVLLQEQLLTFQEECELLKQENYKKSEELKKYKKKIKVSNYQCEKCEKVFISDTYLKFHDKRRHSNPTTPKSLGKALSTGISTSQQTEDEKITISTQTLAEEEIVDIIKTNEMNKIIKENDAKIENLERELEDLKTRFRKTESNLNEKTESPHQHFQSPFFYPQMVPFLTPYTLQPNYFGGNNNHISSENTPQQNQQSIHPKPPTDPEYREEKVVVTRECPDTTPKYKSEIKVDVEPSNQIPEQPKLESDNEILNFNLENIPLNSKPIPLPRQPKKMFSTPLLEMQTTVEPFVTHERHSMADIQFNQTITCSSTPVKETKAEPKEVLRSIERDSLSIESLILEEIPVERKKSLFKRVMSRKAPELQELSKNLKRSLNSLYDSVSFVKNKEKNQDSKSDLIIALNNQLRELGVDPEWSGIPNKTMKQKLKHLKHQRKLMAKENPMYSTIRHSLEKVIGKKLVKNTLNLKKEASNKDTNEQESIETQNSIQTEMQQITTYTEIVKPKRQNSVMYDIERGSESEISLAEPHQIQETLDQEPPQPLPQKQDPKPKLSFLSESESEEVALMAVEKEFDFSVFQVTKSLPKLEIPVKEMSVYEIQTDSDFDDDFLEEFDTKSLKTVAEVFEIKKKEKEVPEKEKKDGNKVEVLLHEKERKEDHFTLKSDQSKP